MGDSTTIALNLTFFGTLGLALLMFLGLFLMVILTLVLAGIGRLLVVAVQALFGRLPKNETLPLARLTGDTTPSSPSGTMYDDGAAAPSPTKSGRAGVPRVPAILLRTWAGALRRVRERLNPAGPGPAPQAMAEDWAAAVADADARAMDRARAAAPEIKVTVRDLPPPSLPAAKVEAVAPLVESALHQDVPVREDVPGTRPQTPLAPLDTGSLESLNGRAKLLRAKLPANKS